jgi:hypothetical protein
MLMEVYNRSEASALSITYAESIIRNKKNCREINLILLSVQSRKQDPQ